MSLFRLNGQISHRNGIVYYNFDTNVSILKIISNITGFNLPGVPKISLPSNDIYLYYSKFVNVIQPPVILVKFIHVLLARCFFYC